MRQTVGALAGAACLVLALAACTPDATPAPTATVTVEAHTTVTATPQPTVDASLVANPFARPDTLGTVPLEVDENGLAKPLETPPEMINRQFEPGPSAHEDPATDEWFVTISEVPDDVLARSSWTADCPIAAEDLAYIVMPFWGFDNKAHTGEMLIAAKHAQDIAGVFEFIYEKRFPIEEMRVRTYEDVLGENYGDQNVTSSFECRRSTGGYPTWGEHASGNAIDINPFHNPWVRDGYVYPEYASAYIDRTWLRPGMIETRKQIVKEFQKIGWFWGGDWTTFEDWMHFSPANR